jgi:hypothetical protein
MVNDKDKVADENIDTVVLTDREDTVVLTDREEEAETVVLDEELVREITGGQAGTKREGARVARVARTDSGAEEAPGEPDGGYS